MAERLPDDTHDEERKFLATPLGQAILGGKVAWSKEMDEAIDKLHQGDMSHPITQQLVGETLIEEAFLDAPDDIVWLAENVLPED